VAAVLVSACCVRHWCLHCRVMHTNCTVLAIDFLRLSTGSIGQLRCESIQGAQANCPAVLKPLDTVMRGCRWLSNNVLKRLVFIQISSAPGRVTGRGDGQSIGFVASSCERRGPRALAMWVYIGVVDLFHVQSTPERYLRLLRAPQSVAHDGIE
jgi:hypothetical protein